MTLNELFKNTTYDDTLFSVEDKSTIESRIFMKSVRGSEVPYITCAIRDKDYNREPPPDIDWPTDEEAKFTWFYYEMLKLNKDGARVLLKGKIDFAEHHYETECTVRWNESLSETAIKNASITSVVDSQEKELAAAI